MAERPAPEAASHPCPRVNSNGDPSGVGSRVQAVPPSSTRRPSPPRDEETTSTPSRVTGRERGARSRGTLHRVSPEAASSASIRGGSPSATRHRPSTKTGEAGTPIDGSRFSTSRCQSSFPSRSRHQITEPNSTTTLRPSETGVAPQREGRVNWATGDRVTAASTRETSRRQSRRPSLRDRHNTAAEKASGCARMTRSPQITGLPLAGRGRGYRQARPTPSFHWSGSAFPGTTPSPVPLHPSHGSAESTPLSTSAPSHDAPRERQDPARNPFHPGTGFGRCWDWTSLDSNKRKVLITKGYPECSQVASCEFFDPFEPGRRRNRGRLPELVPERGERHLATSDGRGLQSNPRTRKSP